MIMRTILIVLAVGVVLYLAAPYILLALLVSGG